MSHANRKQEGKYDWFGTCDPGRDPAIKALYKSFSVGIFQWRKNSKGKLTRGGIELRIIGSTYEPEKVYELAEFWCERLDEGSNPGVKTLNAQRR